MLFAILRAIKTPKARKNTPRIVKLISTQTAGITLCNIAIAKTSLVVCQNKSKEQNLLDVIGPFWELGSPC
jgi:hypothetical protein